MPIREQEKRRAYFKDYMARRRAQGQTKPQGSVDGDGVKPATPPLLNRDLPFREIPRPFPYSALVEQDGKMFDRATGFYVGDVKQ
jgi:hypothetical protein